jgi:hypothetical protein
MNPEFYFSHLRITYNEMLNLISDLDGDVFLPPLILLFKIHVHLLMIKLRSMQHSEYLLLPIIPGECQILKDQILFEIVYVLLFPRLPRVTAIEDKSLSVFVTDEKPVVY